MNADRILQQQTENQKAIHNEEVMAYAAAHNFTLPPASGPPKVDAKLNYLQRWQLVPATGQDLLSLQQRAKWKKAKDSVKPITIVANKYFFIYWELTAACMLL